MWWEVLDLLSAPKQSEKCTVPVRVGVIFLMLRRIK
jgi:hypothetical protein